MTQFFVQETHAGQFSIHFGMHCLFSTMYLLNLLSDHTVSPSLINRIVVSINIVHLGHFLVNANFLFSFDHIPVSHIVDITMYHSSCHHITGHSSSVVLYAIIPPKSIQ